MSGDVLAETGHIPAENSDIPGDILRVEDLAVGTAGGAGALPILKGISFSIGAGETLCLVGESGSGKSVTALSIMGLLPKGELRAAAGRILLGGEDMLAASANRMRELRASRMAMIFQEPMTALNPVLTVGRQIEEVLEAHISVSARQQRVRVLDMLAEVRLPDIERIYGAYPHQLSGGQRQRIMIAMALILEPQLLIADEPTTALDVTTQKQILKLIRELQERHGTSVLFVTHDMGVVADIADRVAVMHHGRIVETDSTAEILRRPKRDYTRDLLMAVPSLIPRPVRRAESPETVLQTTELGKIYGGAGLFRRTRSTVAAEGVSFALRRGRTLGIVGESGSGKSTVARCVTRLIEPTSGGIRVRGQEISGLSRAALRPHRQHIQMVFQDPYRSLNPRVTVGESIAEGPVNFGTPHKAALAKARDLLELVGLPADAATRYPHQFSGGQRQRIAIARALAIEPEVLVADEAVSALDVSVQAQVLALLGELQQRLGIAILFITHDLRVAAQICDDVAVMREGRIVEYGPADQVLRQPSQIYTRELIDAAPGRDWDFANFRPLTPDASIVAT
jgi:ABC-type glutathione transport system ATPase component